MIFSLYLLIVLYTNTMGLIIIAKCKPFIDREIESKGYRIKEKNDTELLMGSLFGTLKFFIPAYYLKKAVELSGKDFNIDKTIDDKVASGEIVKSCENSIRSKFVSIQDDNSKMSLSLGKYEKRVPYRASNESMYLDQRLGKDEDIDMDFWEEKESDVVPYLEETVEAETIQKEPLREYLDSMSEEEINEMVNQLDRIMKLKKDNETFLNQNTNY